VARMSPDGDGSRPGSEVTLIALYDAVPATEELDLREEWEREQAESVKDLLSALDDADGSDDEPDDEAAEPLTERQVFGMIEHMLGAELVEDARDGDDQPDD